MHIQSEIEPSKVSGRYFVNLFLSLIYPYPRSLVFKNTCVLRENTLCYSYIFLFLENI
jgi:hypothetical protein